MKKTILALALFLCFASPRAQVVTVTARQVIPTTTLPATCIPYSLRTSTAGASICNSAGTAWNLIASGSGGVTSITGTANQVVASASTGAVTFSLPQSIATTSTPQFSGIGLGTAAISEAALRINRSFTDVESAALISQTGLLTSSASALTNAYGFFNNPIFRNTNSNKISFQVGYYNKMYLWPNFAAAATVAADDVVSFYTRFASYSTSLGTYTNATAFDIGQFNSEAGSSTINITNSYGLRTANMGAAAGIGGVVVVTSAAGVAVAAQSGATNNTHLLLGTTTIPTGNYAIYSSSTSISYLAGMMQLGGTLFAALGSPTNGTVTYCSDCTKATPCGSGGTGALAKRLNGAWDCD